MGIYGHRFDSLIKNESVLIEAYYINSGEKIVEKGYCISEEDPREVKKWKGESLMFSYSVFPTIQEAIKHELKYAGGLEENPFSMYLCKACYINDDYRGTRLGDLVEEFKSLKALAIKYKVDYSEAEERLKNKANAEKEKEEKYPVKDFIELYEQAANIMVKSLEQLKRNSQIKAMVRQAIIEKVPKKVNMWVNRYKEYYNKPKDEPYVANYVKAADEFIKYYSSKSFPIPEIKINNNMTKNIKNVFKPFSFETLYPIESVDKVKPSNQFKGEVEFIVMEIYIDQMFKETKDDIKKLKVGNFRVKSVSIEDGISIQIKNNYTY